MENKTNISKEEKELVLERIKALSEDVIISIGSNELTREEIINSIEIEDETGKDIVKAQMDYLKAMASGEIYNYV